VQLTKMASSVIMLWSAEHGTRTAPVCEGWKERERAGRICITCYIFVVM